MYWLVIKLIWPVERQNKGRWESQTENIGRKKNRVREINSHWGSKMLEDR